jgi:ATP-dependent DNA ligase
MFSTWMVGCVCRTALGETDSHHQLFYMAFDLLYYGGKDITQSPLETRRGEFVW